MISFNFFISHNVDWYHWNIWYFSFPFLKSFLIWKNKNKTPFKSLHAYWFKKKKIHSWNFNLKFIDKNIEKIWITNYKKSREKKVYIEIFSYFIFYLIISYFIFFFVFVSCCEANKTEMKKKLFSSILLSFLI